MGWLSVWVFLLLQGIDKRKYCICFPGGSLFLCTESVKETGFILSLQIWANTGHQQGTVLELTFYISRNSSLLKLKWRPTRVEILTWRAREFVLDKLGIYMSFVVDLYYTAYAVFLKHIEWFINFLQRTFALILFKDISIYAEW